MSCMSFKNQERSYLCAKKRLELLSLDGLWSGQVGGCRWLLEPDLCLAVLVRVLLLLRHAMTMTTLIKDNISLGWLAVSEVESIIIMVCHGGM